MKVKGTGPRCLLEECVKGNYITIIDFILTAIIAAEK